MMIVACIGVRDEVELIGHCVNHLRMIGIDRFLVFDLSSADGTRDVLATYESCDFTVVDIPKNTSTKSLIEQSTRIIKTLDADWVFLVDADEFPLPKGGNVRNCKFLYNKDVARVSRFNVAIGSDGPLVPDVLAADQYDKIWLVVEPMENFRELIFQEASIPWIRAIPAPKIVARLNRFDGFTDGGHQILPTSGPPLRRVVPDDLIVAHLPITSLERFKTKIRNIRETLSLNQEHYASDAKLAWHWKRWLDLDQTGELEEEFRRSVWDETILDALKNEGVLRSARSMFDTGG